jgi:hypothetical protein
MKQHNQEAGKGVLFQNDKKTGERQPDYKGLITLDRDVKAGEQVKLAAWVKKTQVGNLISLAQDNFVPDPSYRKQPMAEPEGTMKRPREHDPFKDDDVPF